MAHEEFQMRNFVETARCFLNSAKGQWTEVAKATGIQHQYICRIMDGRIKDPGASKIQRILDYAEATGWDDRCV